MTHLQEGGWKSIPALFCTELTTAGRLLAGSPPVPPSAASWQRRGPRAGTATYQEPGQLLGCSSERVHLQRDTTQTLCLVSGAQKMVTLF